MIDLYHKNIWNDEKTVNVIAEACLSKEPKIISTAVHFFLGSNDHKKKEEDDEDGPDLESVRHQMLINKKKGSRATLLEKAKATIRRGFAEKLFSRLRSSTTNNTIRFELRLHIMNLVTRLIGAHKLLLLGFYDFVIPYLRPSQKEVPLILACVAQASHDLVPPDVMEPVVQAIANQFVWSNAASEVVTAGLNALREICIRCPLAMTESLLQSLIEDYKNHREKGVMMAGRSLLALYREVNPEMLRKKHRGKGATMSMKEFKAPVYGQVNISEALDGVELLLENSEQTATDGDPGEGWEGWEVESVPSPKSKKSRKQKSPDRENDNVGTIVVGEDGQEEVVDDADDDEWEDEDDSGGDDAQSSGCDTCESGDDEDDESDAATTATATTASQGASRVGPKQLKLQAKRVREESARAAEVSPSKKQKLIELSMERIYTDEDFARMRARAADRKAELMAGVKRSHAAELLEEEEDDDDEEGSAPPAV
ncbi:Severe Depolymerization of Actin [Cladochytrium tenue]|nr:Severe Depolymerization of Actin [Cladochytrium tenue]